MVDSPSPPTHTDRRSRSRTPSGSSRSSAVRNGTSTHTHHSQSTHSSKEYSSSSRSKSYKDVIKIVQVANIAPQATREHMHMLFEYVGKTVDIRLYPSVDIGLQLQSKICFVKFLDASSVGTAQHLTNTVFMDRALIVIPYLDGDIPDENRAQEILSSGSLLPGIADPKLPQHVTSQVEGFPPLHVVVTRDPLLIERNMPSYPPLAPTVDSRKIEEIRRTVLVCNVDPDLSSHDVVDFFSSAGEVKYLRFCTRDNDPLKFALIEFSDQPSILEALEFNGHTLGQKVIRVYHATQAIIKPQAKTNEAAQKEIEEAMSRQAQNILTHGLDNAAAPSVKEKRRSRSRSRSHTRRSRSRGRRRSRSRSRRRSRSRSKRSTSRHRDKYRAKAKRSRSRSRDRRRSRSKRRSRSVGRVRIRRTRSKSPHPPRRSRSRSRKRDDNKKKSKKDKDRDKDKERDKDRTKEKDHKENGIREEIEPPKEKKKSDRRSRSPKQDSKKRRRSRSRSRKARSPSHEKKKSKSKKKKKEASDREPSVDSLGQSRGSSQEKDRRSSKKDLSGDLEYDDKMDLLRSHGDMDDGRLITS